MNDVADDSRVLAQLGQNAKRLRFWYALSGSLLAAALIAHLGYSVFVFQSMSSTDYPKVALFAVVSVSALAVEVLLARVAFMLAARVGQLFDAIYSIGISNSKIDIVRFEAASRVLTTLRRHESALKILDIERAVQTAASTAVQKSAA